MVFILGKMLPRGTQAQQVTYGFTVQRSTNYLNAPPEVTIQFDRVVTNHGGMWDALNHMFRSPNKGLYMFHMYVFRDNKAGYSESYIVKNTEKLAVAHINAGYPHGDSSVSLVVALNPLDRVFCRHVTGILYSDYKLGAAMIHFSGFLIATL